MSIPKNLQKKLDKLINYLQNLPETGCAWYEGSFARNEQDQFSDIDLWVDCENGKEKELFSKIVKFLSQAENTNPFVAHNFGQDHPEIFQNYIIINDFVLDLCIQSQKQNSKSNFCSKRRS
jgi:predicted nucleotidyltransferase